MKLSIAVTVEKLVYYLLLIIPLHSKNCLLVKMKIWDQSLKDLLLLRNGLSSYVAYEKISKESILCKHLHSK